MAEKRNPSKADRLSGIIERIKRYCSEIDPVDVEFLSQILFDLINIEMERDAYKVRYTFLSQHTGLKAYLDGSIEKITKGGENVWIRI